MNDSELGLKTCDNSYKDCNNYNMIIKTILTRLVSYSSVCVADSILSNIAFSLGLACLIQSFSAA